MKENSRLLVIRAIVTVVTLFHGIVPVVMDLNDTHLLNPGWSPHARLHGAWFLSFSAAMAGVALFLTWVRKEIMLPIVIGLMFVAGFWAATLMSSLYGGALADPNMNKESWGLIRTSLCFQLQPRSCLALYSWCAGGMLNHRFAAAHEGQSPFGFSLA